MSECMTFPDTVEEFIEQYKVVDADHVYSNGIEFIPIFRMKQWFEHLPSVQPYTDEQIQRMQDMEQAMIEAAFKLGQEDAKPQWIPVSDRLPDKAGAYLITHYDGDVFPRYYDGEDSSKKFWKSYIKAWMPLPEPYQEEGEQDG